MPAILGIMFCEFDNLQGPTITFQQPADLISKEQMDSIAQNVITKPNFHNSLICVKAFGYKFLGFSVGMMDARYPRNGLLFNANFILPHNVTAQEYEPVVIKLASYLQTLEMEASLISDPIKKLVIPDILAKIMDGLNSNGQCTIPIDKFNKINLKLLALPKRQPSVQDHDVPVFLWNKNSILNQHWDLTATKIIPQINGFNHVQRIAALSNMDLGLVQSAVQTLQYHGVITLIPVFLYTNMYAIKPDIVNLSKDKAMQEECIRYVAREPKEGEKKVFPKFRNVFMLYCALGPGVTVRDLCSRHNSTDLFIDEKKLIIYGLIKGFLSKLNKYPVLLSATQSSSGANSQRNKNIPKSLQKWLTGYYNYDEICCKSNTQGKPFQFEEIDRVTEDSPFCVHIWK